MENVGESVLWGLVVAAGLVGGAVIAAVLRLPSRVAAILTASAAASCSRRWRSSSFPRQTPGRARG